MQFDLAISYSTSNKLFKQGFVKIPGNQSW